MSSVQFILDPIALVEAKPAAARELEKLAAGTEPAAIHETVGPGVLVAMHVGFNPALEKIEIPVAVKIDELIEVTRSYLTPAMILAEPIPVANDAVITARLAVA